MTASSYTIVVGVDFSPASLAALRQAARLATRADATLRVVHVVERTTLYQLRDVLDEAQVNALEAATIEQATAHLEDELSAIDLPRRVVFDVVRGHAPEVLIDRAMALGVKLLCLGSSAGASDQGDIGAVAARCTRRCKTDVLLVQAQHHGPFRTIVAGVDLSPRSEAVVARAAEQVRLDNAAALELLHVYSGHWHILRYRERTQTPPTFEQAIIDNLEARLAELVATASAAGAVAHVSLLEHQKVARGLAQKVRELDADLLVVGRRGHSRIVELLVGLTAERVVRLAPCSVLLVEA
ncbi:MAG: universal stress protein [Myxococcales bacterium]|nr:universal stress protein [Myxococcales bacterium]